MTTTTETLPTIYRARYVWTPDASTFGNHYPDSHPARSALAAAPPGSYVEVSDDGGQTWRNVDDPPPEPEPEPATPAKSHTTPSGDATVAPESSTALTVTPIAGPRSVRVDDWFAYDNGETIEFYRVTGFTDSEKSAYLERHARSLDHHDAAGDHVRPGDPTGEIITKRLQVNDIGNDYVMAMDLGHLARWIDTGENTLLEGAGAGEPS